MQYIIKHQAADIEYIVRDQIREHQGNPGQYEQRHSEIHGNYVSELLKGVELLFFGDRKRMRLFFENPDRIKLKLLPEIDNKVLPPFSVIASISGNHISDNKNTVVQRNNNRSCIMHSDRHVKRNQAVLHTVKMKGYPSYYQQYEHESIDNVPDPDPYRVEKDFCCGHFSCFSV